MEEKMTIKLPLIPLRGLTVFPDMTTSLPIGRTKSLEALEYATKHKMPVFLITQKDATVQDPERQDLYDIGTIATVKQVLKLPGNLNHVIVEGEKRAKLIQCVSDEQCDYGNVMEIEQDFEGDISPQEDALMRIAMDCFGEYVTATRNRNTTELLLAATEAAEAKQPGKLADVIAGILDINEEQKQYLLELVAPEQRLRMVIQTVNYEIEILKIKKSLETDVRQKMDKTQKDYFLKEEMKVIQQKLGDKDGTEADAEKFRQILEQKNPPQEVKEAVEKEIQRMLKIPVSSPEYNVSRSYIETVLALPWNEKIKSKFDLKRAEKILEQDHYGLKKVKERILEHLAVRKFAPKGNSTILCLVGPPGVGKTSIAKSIASALNLKYVRMSLGGIRDEAEIRGHRKTYVGAMPGRIMYSMKQAGTINPLMLLDEVDKLNKSYNGDPAAALLEVLDGEQNSTFRDHYIELPYDLSQVFFICTANTTDTIPAPLRDRMEIIQLSSYTSQEKKHIALEHLVKKQKKRHGLKPNQLTLCDGVIDNIIEGYTKEAGVRQLERMIGTLCRKAVKMILSKEKTEITILPEQLEDYIGAKKYHTDTIYNTPQIGIVRGLAWTQFGGETLSIEVNTMAGTGKFELTGNMGKVMQESAKAAMSYIRSQCERLNAEDNFYKEKDIHIHIPEGAIPKDGPSAGITMALAMLSALTNAKIRNDVAMTGEITLRGRVLPIGGLKEKILAGKKAGIVKIILPKQNERDLKEIEQEIKQGLEFVLAETMEDVIQNALAEGEKIWK
ncbi:endopeptidase La [Lachnospiraceae bacterium 46-61]